MKWFFTNFFRFFYDLFSGASDVSSKRFNGTLCVVSVIILIIISVIFAYPISKEIIPLVKMIFWGGTGLLGLGMADKFLKNK